MGKQHGVHAHSEILLSHKKGDNMPMSRPATRKEVETIIVSEVRQRKTSII